MTKEKLMAALDLENEIKELESGMKDLERMKANRQIYVRGRDDAGANLEIAIPNQLRNAVVVLLSDYFKQRLTEAKEEFNRL